MVSLPQSKHVHVLHTLHELPKKVMLHQHKDDLAAFVLHELCHESIFNLEKAAYLVNNVDFNCIRGVAGYDKNDAFQEFDHHWQQPDEFSLRLKSSAFNKTVRDIFSRALVPGQVDEAMSVIAIAEDLGIEHPEFICWDLKHENHGYFVYERPAHHDDEIKKYLHNGIFVLSFCPLF